MEGDDIEILFYFFLTTGLKTEKSTSISAPKNADSAVELDRIRFRKYNGEKIMFRGMFAICLLTTMWKPALFSINQWIFQWSWWWGWIGAFFFGLFWWLASLSKPNQE
jgi:hypothetical protein